MALVDIYHALNQSAQELSRILEDGADQRIVLAESCTCGLIAAALGSVPGISRYLCGSAVTYRRQTKAAWLDVPQDVLERYSEVSAEATRALAAGVLKKTEEANLAAAITGHLGPNVEPDQDGLVWIVIAGRSIEETQYLECRSWTLVTSDRVARQCEAARLVLDRLRNQLLEQRRRSTMRNQSD